MNTKGLCISVVAAFAALPLAVPPIHAQKAGQSARISVGVVVKTERVNLQSEAGKSAVVGGVIGYHATSSKKSSSRKWRNAAIGAAAMGAARRAGEGDLSGMMYSVQLTDGSLIKVVSDQSEIRIGDCVTVEQVRDNANVRRVDSSMCEPAAKEVLAEVEDELQEEAEECYAAKQELLEATTDEAAERAALKVKILCNS
jgi:flagellar motor protein MotB